jgi:tryptophan 2,3-dioxygenase
MKPKDFITQIQRVADTEPKHSHVTASDVQRIISVAFRILATMSASEYTDTTGKLTSLAAKTNLRKGTAGLKPRKK